MSELAKEGAVFGPFAKLAPDPEQLGLLLAAVVAASGPVANLLEP